MLHGPTLGYKVAAAACSSTARIAMRAGQDTGTHAFLEIYCDKRTKWRLWVGSTTSNIANISAHSRSTLSLAH